MVRFKDDRVNRLLPVLRGFGLKRCFFYVERLSDAFGSTRNCSIQVKLLNLDYDDSLVSSESQRFFVILVCIRLT